MLRSLLSSSYQVEEQQKQQSPESDQPSYTGSVRRRRTIQQMMVGMVILMEIGVAVASTAVETQRSGAAGVESM